MRIAARWLCVGLVLSVSPVWADDLNSAKTYGPYTITATGTLPASVCAGGTNNGVTCTVASECPGATCAVGQRLSEYDETCTVQLDVVTGSISLDVEGALEKSAGWVTLGTLTSSTLQSLQAPLDFMRFTTTAIGKLCVGGANNGNACTAASVCPGGTCPTASSIATVRCRAGR